MTSKCTLSSAETEIELPRPAAEAASPGGGHKKAKQQDIFTGKEITSLYCSCEKDAVADWDVTVLGRVKSKCGAAHRVLMWISSLPK